MSVTGASIIAQVSVSGYAEAKTQLESVGQQAQQAGAKAKEGGLGLAGMFKNALSFAAGGAIFAGLSFLKDQIGGIFTESMNAQAGLAQTNQVLASTHGVAGVTAQAVLDLATQYSHLTKFSDDTVQASENMLLTFTHIGKNVFPLATKSVLDMSQALGQDTKSSAIELGKALDDPIAGIAALHRVGVDFDPIQKNLIKNFMSTNNIAGAQGVILKEVQKEFGGSAVAAGKTFGGQLAILGQRMDDVKQTLGDALMPMITKLVNWISSNVVPVLLKFSDWFVKNGVPALQRFGTFVGNVVSYLSDFSKHSDVLVPILAGLGTVLAAVVVPAVWSLAAGVIAATWPFIAVGLAVAGVVAIFKHFYDTNAGFRKFIDDMVAGVKLLASIIGTVIGKAVDLFTNNIEKMRLQNELKMTSMRITTDTETAKGAQLAIGNLEKQRAGILLKLQQTHDPAQKAELEHQLKMNTLQIENQTKRLAAAEKDKQQQLTKQKELHDAQIEAQKNFAQRFLDMVGKWLGNVFSAIGTWARDTLTKFKNFFGDGISNLGSFVRNFLDNIGKWKDSVILKVAQMVTDFVNNLKGIPGKLAGLASDLISAGANIVKNIASGITGAIGNFIGGAMSAVGSFIHDHLPSSPAKVGPLRDLQKQGSLIPQQIAQGIVAGQHHLSGALGQFLRPMTVGVALSGTGSMSGLSGSVAGGLSSSVARSVTTGGAPVINLTLNVSPEVNMDGVRLTRQVLPHLYRAIKYNT